MTTVPMLSVHAIGRAIDLMVPMAGRDADNTLGDQVANWLVENAESIGIQRVIWDKAFWNGQRGFGPLASTSLPHTDHIHVELSVDGANKRTPFFTSGASGGGTTCPARCEGTRLVEANCTSRDCAMFGATCVPGSPPRCGTPGCPSTGSATICLDTNRLLTCRDGVATGPAGECGRFGGYCSTAGATPTTARCVLAQCVGSAMTAPYDRRTCGILGGRQLECRANNTFTETSCPAGQVCVDRDGVTSCQPPVQDCPIPPMGAPLVERVVCVDDATIAQCINGNLFNVRTCAPGSCRRGTSSAVCAARECVRDGAIATGPVCLGGYLATCASDGTPACLQACPDGTRCDQPPNGAVRCVPGEPTLEDTEGLPAPGACGISVPSPSDAGTSVTDAGGTSRDGAPPARDGGRLGPIEPVGCACRAPAAPARAGGWTALAALGSALALAARARRTPRS
jgi:hypothetical protein